MCVATCGPGQIWLFSLDLLDLNKPVLFFFLSNRRYLDSILKERKCLGCGLFQPIACGIKISKWKTSISWELRVDICNVDFTYSLLANTSHVDSTKLGEIRKKKTRVHTKQGESTSAITDWHYIPELHFVVIVSEKWCEIRNKALKELVFFFKVLYRIWLCVLLKLFYHFDSILP